MPEKHIGIEIEFNLSPNPIGKLWEALYAAAVDRYVEIHHEDAEWELSILAPQSGYASVLSVVMSILRTCGAQFNYYCGLHVHLDARGMDAHALYERLQPYSAELIAMTTEERQRYHAYGNGYSVYRAGYETLEVRFMDANTDFERTNKYIQTLIQYAYPAL